MPVLQPLYAPESAEAAVLPRAVLQAIAALSADAVVVAVERHGTLVPVWTNPAADQLVGGAPGSVLQGGFDALGLVPGHESGSDADPFLLHTPWTQGATAEVDVRCADGSSIVARITTTPISAAGRDYCIVALRGIEARVWADEELRASEERFRIVAAHAPVGVFASEVGLRLGYVNERFAELWGRDMHDVLGMGWLNRVDGDDAALVTDAVCRVLAGEEIDVPLRITRDDGGTRWVRMRATPVVLQGRGAGFVGSVEDVTDDLRHEAELAHQATHDPLTGLPNRALLSEEIRAALAARKPGDAALALLFFDLDNFKLVNDSLGHVAGDDLLMEVAARLKDRVREGDTVARFGGDEFVVLCRRVESEAVAITIAQRLLDALARPVSLSGHELVTSASVGVVMTSDAGSSVESLIADADVAMYQAKEAGRNRYALFDMDVRSSMQERLTLVHDLRRAIERDDLDIAFQPVVDVASGALVSVEALLRWEHPTRGPVRPDHLVAVAEETGMIAAVGAWVLRRSCAQLAAWRTEYGDAAPRYVAVNVSGLQITQTDLPSVVEAALADAGLCGGDLCLELTESVLMANTAASLATMDRLKRQGVRLAIDDFGTGYSSLAYLKRFPVEVLKVDKSFVSNLTADAEDAAIVAAVIAMARALGLSVVAEGVETAEQLEELRRFGCTFAQGYLLGRPSPAGVLAAATFRRSGSVRSGRSTR